jgi:hypothetical protein
MMEPTRPSASAASISRTESAAVGAVYTMSNDAAANAVIAFTRHGDGTLGPAVSFSTGGAGTGTGLGSDARVRRQRRVTAGER